MFNSHIQASISSRTHKPFLKRLFIQKECDVITQKSFCMRNVKPISLPATNVQYSNSCLKLVTQTNFHCGKPQYGGPLKILRHVCYIVHSTCIHTLFHYISLSLMQLCAHSANLLLSSHGGSLEEEEDSLEEDSLEDDSLEEDSLDEDSLEEDWLDED